MVAGDPNWHLPSPPTLQKFRAAIGKASVTTYTRSPAGSTVPAGIWRVVRSRSPFGPAEEVVEAR